MREKIVAVLFSIVIIAIPLWTLAERALSVKEQVSVEGSMIDCRIEQGRTTADANGA